MLVPKRLRFDVSNKIVHVAVCVGVGQIKCACAVRVKAKDRFFVGRMIHNCFIGRKIFETPSHVPECECVLSDSVPSKCVADLCVRAIAPVSNNK